VTVATGKIVVSLILLGVSGGVRAGSAPQTEAVAIGKDGQRTLVPALESELSRLSASGVRLGPRTAVSAGPESASRVAVVVYPDPANLLHYELRVLEATGSEVRTAAVLQGDGEGPGFPFPSLQGADITRSGFPDIIFQSDIGGSSLTSGAIKVLQLNHASLRELFSGPIQSIEDLNGDGRSEVVVVADSPDDEADACQACKEGWWIAYQWRNGKFIVARDPAIRGQIAARIRAGRQELLTDLERRSAMRDSLEPWETHRLQRLRLALGKGHRKTDGGDTSDSASAGSSTTSLSKAGAPGVELPTHGVWLITLSVGDAPCAGTLSLSTSSVTGKDRGLLSGAWTCNSGNGGGGAVAGVNGHDFVLYLYTGPAGREKRAYEIKGTVLPNQLTGTGDGNGRFVAVRSAAGTGAEPAPAP
jgi:hypothetical protein